MRVRLHYEEAGEGEPVLLVHGWPQHSAMWRHQVGPLAERFRVITPDLRGHGRSPKPPSGYRKAELLDDLLGLLDDLGIERVRWVGHDWGAYVGMLAGLRTPERVQKLVAMSIPHPWSQGLPDPRLVLNSTYQLVLGGPFGQIAMERLNFAGLVLRRARTIGSYSDDELEMYESVQRRPDAARATVQLYRSFLLHELPGFARGGLGRLTVPTLWLVGDRDPVGRFADDGYRDHADDMTLERFPGAGHFLPEELPETVLERLLDFL
jgi:pimeloyl-ACP methyl ester carboxylesterase